MKAVQAAGTLMERLTLIFLLVALLLGSAQAEPCREASITEPAPFTGNNEEIFHLDDCSIWKVQYEYEYLYEYYPRVVICPDQGKLIIKGKALTVTPLTPSSRRNHPLIPSNLPGGRSGQNQAKNLARSS